MRESGRIVCESSRRSGSGPCLAFFDFPLRRFFSPRGLSSRDSQTFASPVTAGHHTLICWASSSQVLALVGLEGAMAQELRHSLKQHRQVRPPPNNPSKWRPSHLRVCHDHINQFRTSPTEKQSTAITNKPNPEDEILTLQVFWRLQFHQVACLLTARRIDSQAGSPCCFATQEP